MGILAHDEHIRGERALCWAIIERAILDALGFGLAKVDCPKVKQKQAIAWLLDSKMPNAPQPFSVLWRCFQLDICPKRIRKLIINEREAIRRGGDSRSMLGRQKNRSRGFEVADMIFNLGDDQLPDSDYISNIR